MPPVGSRLRWRVWEDALLLTEGSVASTAASQTAGRVAAVACHAWAGKEDLQHVFLEEVNEVCAGVFGGRHVFIHSYLKTGPMALTITSHNTPQPPLSPPFQKNLRMHT